MSKHTVSLFWLLLSFTLPLFTSCNDNDEDSNDLSTEVNDNCNIATADNAYVTRIEFPHLKGGHNKVITHTNKDFGVNYSIEWDCEKKSQRWTCYILTKDNKKKNTSRYFGDPQYPRDPNLTADEYWDEDYFYGSGLDHGHICPSNDRLYNDEVNYQTFYLTNMQPQYPAFNGSQSTHKYKGLWINMENFVYNIKLGTGDTLYVCKGGTIDKESQILMRIKQRLIVPKYFFAALLLKKSDGNYRSLGFWFEHSKDYYGDDPLADYTCTIDELEQYTSIDFFCNLPDGIEKSVEKVCYPIDWGLQ